MFGSKTAPSGHSSGNPFAPNTFGVPANPFAPKPFGVATNITSPFGMSNSSGTTSGTVGATSPSPFPSTTTFGGPTPAFGVSTTGLGFTSAPALGFSSSGFGGSGHSSGNPFAPNPFCVPANPLEPKSFGVATNIASPFGMSNSSGTTSGAVGATSPSPFPSTTTFGGPTPAFGVSTTGLGFTSAPALGFSSSGFGAFGQKLVSTGVGLSSNPTFQSTMAFDRSNSLGTTKSSFGPEVTTPSFGTQNRGSSFATYKRTREVDPSPKEKEPQYLVSISAMPVYKDKSHEELRSEDYLFSYKGGAVLQNFNMKSNASNSPSPSVTPNNTSTSNMFASPNPVSVSSSPFSSTSFSNFLANSPGSTSVLQTTPASGPNSLSKFSHPSSSLGFATTLPLLNNSSSSPNFTSSLFTDSLNPSTSRNPYSFTTPATSSVSSVFNSSSFTNSFTSSCRLSTSVTLPAVPFAHTTSSLLQPSSSPNLSLHSFSSATPGNSFSPFANSPPTTLVPTLSTAVTVPDPSLPVTSPSIATSISPQWYSPQNSIKSVTVKEAGGQNSIAQWSDSQTTPAGKPSSCANPFGSLPPSPKIFTHGPTVQYGISNLPVQINPAPVRVSSLLTIRHLLRRIRLPVQKYDPKVNGPKVPFFSDDREIPDSQFVPRENPRALVIRPTEHWPLRANSGKLSVLGEKLSSTHLYDNSENCTDNVDIHSNELYPEQTDDSAKERKLSVKVPKVEALLPKLQLSGYYTEPGIQELAAKERADPGFCSHVKNFVVGRHGYGHIKFMGTTDVRGLDLDSDVEFNNREVIVYKDEKKKPPVGEGLNKPAEVTLLNIKCFDKKTGYQCMDGAKLDKYREMLMKKAAEQGAEFMSYNPAGGVWKFRVQHF